MTPSELVALADRVAVFDEAVLESVADSYYEGLSRSISGGSPLEKATSMVFSLYRRGAIETDEMVEELMVRLGAAQEQHALIRTATLADLLALEERMIAKIAELLGKQ